MAAFSSKGTRILLTKGGATPTTLTPTAITSAKPAVVTVADVTGITKGDLVMVGSVGFPELNNKVFVVGTVDGTGKTFELVGSNTANSTGSLSATPEIKHYVAGDLVTLCLSGLTINNSEPGTISVATFCNPSASLPSATQEAGTISVTGYVDETAADYLEMIAASKDAKERILQIMFPSPHGSLVAPVTFSQMGFEVPIDGAPSWSMTGVLGASFEYLV